MAVDRREFIKIAGVSVIGLTLGPALKLEEKVEASEGKVRRDPKALKGKRWAMVVDTRKCEKCKKCVAAEACHAYHNVPKIPDPKREIKWIWQESFEHAFPHLAAEGEHIGEEIKRRPFVILCNHCKHPPCVRVCPTKATFQREDGIVMMDMHRCIGCRFCMAACPYGSRSFNWMDPRPYITKENPEYPTRTKGVVEKCDFCAERIDQGLLPVCVEACPEKALVFGDINDPNSEVSKLVEKHFTLRRKLELGTDPQVYYII